MRRTTTWVCLAGIVALLWGVCPKVAAADEKKGSDEKKAKKETRYDRLFKDKRRDTARSTFITLHKTDGKLYAEIPLKYLGREMMLGGSISSVTDPTYVTVGMKNFAPLHFYFERQDSSLVMKTPNAVLYNDGTATSELGRRCRRYVLVSQTQLDAPADAPKVRRFRYPHHPKKRNVLCA